MQRLLLTACLSIFLFATHAQTVTSPPSGDNQRSIVKQYIGSIVWVKVVYNSPDVTAANGDDRTGHIWGELVHYGMIDQGFGLGNPAPWRAGANENTTIEFSHDVVLQGKDVPAGKYGLHLKVEESGPWTWILTKNSDAWGSYFYDEKYDAARVDSEPAECEHNEWLTYEFVDRGAESATLALKWENKMVPLEISVPDMKDIYYNTMRSELEGAAGFNYQSWVTASAYLTQQNYKLDEALEWAEAAVSAPFVGTRNWATLQNKASVQMAMGDMLNAQATMMEAVEAPGTTAFQIHGFGRQLITMGMADKALEVFKLNHEKFEGAWPTNVGMARGYSAVGDYEKALKYAKLAHDEAPDDLNKNSMAQAVEKLKQNEDIN